MEEPPRIAARFFYNSLSAIDDPLSPVPAAASSLATSKQGPRPFAVYDHDRLEQKWLEERKKVMLERGEEGQEDVSDTRRSLRAQAVIESVTPARSRPRDTSVVRTPADASWGPTLQRTRSGSTSRPGSASGRRARGHTSSGREEQPSIEQLLAESELGTTTGTPFIRAPSRKQLPTVATTRVASASRPRPQPLDSYLWDDERDQALEPDVKPSGDDESIEPRATVPVGVSRLHHVTMPELNMEPIYWSPMNDISPVVRATWFYKDTMLPVEAPVANMLELGYCELQVWTRTWQDELDSAVEVGAVGEERVLRKLWPERITPPLIRPGTANSGTADMTQSVELPLSNEQYREQQAQAACASLDIFAGHEDQDLKASASPAFYATGNPKSYSNAGVIYANAVEAHILKPTLQPSAYYGRRPLASYIRKGRKLGVHVVRGFDQAAWDRLYPQKKTAKTTKAYAGVSSNEADVMQTAAHDKDPRLSASMSPKVTDLVLVIHGIGQKLSERMESFHFTHAMNAFRRQVNVELGSETVRSRLRSDAGGIMILPINWRQSLSFEEGGYRSEDDSSENQYGLKDITPDTLPSVRGIVSDVMLDIPYYLSHHQPKMIAAVIREANRIYKLWCANNPGFQNTGRVHIIAHSLGSVMALDILSKQPTELPKEVAQPSVSDTDIDLDHFAFRVTNLFVAGSPAGFFLLLKKATLRPRIDHVKVRQDPEANVAAVCGKQGEYGCIAVDNIYNIMNPYDPVSYRLNATVDATYAASLRPAWVPSATPGWFGSSGTDPNAGILSGLFGSSTTATATKRPQLPAAKTSASAFHPLASSAAAPLESMPATGLPRLPSNVELETHNFDKEDVAEKRMYALNDNGQIDYMLKYGGGPLEIQYLTMLGAHSSYWLLKDFVRVVVLEIGREPGRKGVGRGMTAVKKRVL